MLATLGVGKGDRVGLLLPNSPQYVIAWYACQRLGAVAVGNNPLYTQREMAHQLRDSEPRVMIVLDQLWPLLGGGRRRRRPCREVVVTALTDYMRFPLNVLAPIKFRKDAKHEGKPWPPIPSGRTSSGGRHPCGPRRSPRRSPQVDAKKDAAAFVYTGGTTGVSKGAMLSHHNITSNVAQARACFTGFEDGRTA